MQLDNLEFEQSDDLGATPATVSVTMTIKEALWIAKLAGKTRSGDEESHEIYNCLIGDVFNRYFEDGVDEASRWYDDVEVPPIKYED